MFNAKKKEGTTVKLYSCAGKEKKAVAKEELHLARISRGAKKFKCLYELIPQPALGAGQSSSGRKNRGET